MKFVVLLAESQNVLRCGLKSIFLEDSSVCTVDEVKSEIDLRMYLRRSSPDLIVVNQSLISDISLLRSQRFLILAEEPDIKRLQTAYRYDACGYLSINAHAELFRSALRSTEQTFLIEPTLGPWLMEALFYNIQPTIKEDILTPREKEIVGLLREGLGSPQIADQLGIAETTLKVHLKNITRKSDMRGAKRMSATRQIACRRDERMEMNLATRGFNSLR